MKNKAVEKRHAEHRRLAILMFLNEEPGHTLSQYLMQITLEAYGVRKNMDELTEDYEYLRKVGLVSFDQIGHLPALKLTARGLEVVKGTRKVEGVQPPPLDG